MYKINLSRFQIFDEHAKIVDERFEIRIILLSSRIIHLFNESIVQKFIRVVVAGGFVGISGSCVANRMRCRLFRYGEPEYALTVIR